MSTLYVAQLIADERSADLQRRAARAWLAVATRCCRPSTWTRVARRAVAAVSRSPRARTVGVTCCAPV